MSAKRDAERRGLLEAADLDAHLVARSALPGPRGNLELLDAAGDVLRRDDALRLAALGPDVAPSGTALEFLPCCGLVAVGRLVADGETALVELLRTHASDPRWRVRESVAIALQRWADADAAAMFGAVRPWADGQPLEARAAVAAVCEPRLLRDSARAAEARDVLDAATRTLDRLPTPRGEPGRVLGAALGYGWSVAIAADPSTVLPAFEAWARSSDRDIRRVVRENLSKARFIKAAPEAVQRLTGLIAR
jgi:hypothetical protein